MKMTKWYDVKDALPAYAGVYEVDSGYWEDEHSYWNGKQWNGCWLSKETAYHSREFGECSTVLKWRGLAEPPFKKGDRVLVSDEPNPESCYFPLAEFISTHSDGNFHARLIGHSFSCHWKYCTLDES